MTLIVTFFHLLLFSCSEPKEGPPKEVTLAHDKGALPVFQEHFTKQGERARQSVGISIRPIPSDTPDLYRHRMKAILPTKEAPDLFTWWSQFRVKELVDADLIGDLTPLWDKYKEAYSPGMRAAFTMNGKVYGFPYVVEYWPVWYNKSLFNRLGLTPPDTWKAFIEICETVKQSGIPPILLSLQDSWPAFIWFEEMMIGEDPDLYDDLCLGRVRYTDPRVIRAMTLWKGMIEKGYFTDPSANMFTNAGYLWNNERFAMVLCGTWYDSAVLIPQGVDRADIGMFILPSHHPEAGRNIVFEVGPLFTAKESLNAAAAKTLADWWMGSEGNGHFAAMHNAYPGNLKTDISYLPSIKKALLSTIRNEKIRVLNRYWEATPTPICEKAVEKLAEFVLNPASLYGVLEDIDRMAQAYWDNDTTH